MLYKNINFKTYDVNINFLEKNLTFDFLVYKAIERKVAILDVWNATHVCFITRQIFFDVATVEKEGLFYFFG